MDSVRAMPQAATLLWVDLRLDSSVPPATAELQLNEDLYRVELIPHDSDTLEMVAKSAPRVVVFEYDYPYPVGLRALQRTKEAFPGLPLLMITEHHCESLAVWAFRSGARDYLVKPLERKYFVEQLVPLMVSLGPTSSAGKHRQNILDMPPLPVEARVCGREQRKSTMAAKRYVDAHLHERLRLEDMARLCGLDKFQFSRAFKVEHDITFRDYVLGERLRKAAELLRNPHASVGDVAHAVGFRDPTHFAKMFRRANGLSPDAYRNALEPRDSRHVSDPARVPASS